MMLTRQTTNSFLNQMISTPIKKANRRREWRYDIKKKIPNFPDRLELMDVL